MYGYSSGKGLSSNITVINSALSIDQTNASGIIFKYNIPPVSVNPSSAAFAVSGTTLDVPSYRASGVMMKLNVSLGTNKPNPEIDYSIKDRVESIPSGLTINRVPTYGQGQFSTTTTWNTDTEKVNPGFEWFRPLSPQSGAYLHLST